jgi:hypothetical protein
VVSQLIPAGAGPQRLDTILLKVDKNKLLVGMGPVVSVNC